MLGTRGDVGCKWSLLKRNMPALGAALAMGFVGGNGAYSEPSMLMRTKNTRFTKRGSGSKFKFEKRSTTLSGRT